MVKIFKKSEMQKNYEYVNLVFRDFVQDPTWSNAGMLKIARSYIILVITLTEKHLNQVPISLVSLSVFAMTMS